MPKLNDDVDALFRLPLAEFIGARKTLAARLKKDGRADDAERVKLLAKPSISAWAANQLYWQHRQAFDRLIATGQRFHKAQTFGKVADMREALDARREALSHLSDLATTFLRDAGHSPSLDTIRRITTTLEAMSAYASISDGPTPGRLTHDVDPPGFESFASFIPSAGTTKRTEKPAEVSRSKKSGGAATKTRQEATRAGEVSRLEESRQARIAAAKVSLQNAKKSLTAARAKALSLEATKKKADAVAKEAEKRRRESEKQSREAEERFKRASAASEDAADNARSVAIELGEATKALEDGRRSVENATKELESLFREKL
jgi:hypothetical protein